MLVCSFAFLLRVLHLNPLYLDNFPPIHLGPGMLKRFDYQTIILIVICAGILTALFVLIGVVLCLYSKVVKALDAARIVKEADVALSCIDPCKVTHEKIIRVKPIPTESFRTLQCCDSCNVFADVGALQPCICSVSEGL
ncbi:hypothetical protein U0070_001691 [Myodes glareolus]|uniref:Protein FAM24A n=1 Tax=Myodes glareolus TaxID=447135 RepID=A0AAW0JBL1_MYOGA